MNYNRTELIFENSAKKSKFGYLNYKKQFGVDTDYISKEDIDTYLLKCEDDDLRENLNEKNTYDTKDFMEKEIYLENSDRNFISDGKNSRKTITEKYNGSGNLSIFAGHGTIDIVEKIYLDIEFNNEITNKDIFNLLQIEIQMTIGGVQSFKSHIIFSFITALINGIDIFPEINTLRIPLYDFTHCNKCLDISNIVYHKVEFKLNNISNKFSTKSFELKLVGRYTKSLMNIEEKINTRQSHKIWINQRNKQYVKNNRPFRILPNFVTQCILFYYEIEDCDFSSSIESISFRANGHEWLTFECDELISVYLYNFKVYIVCLDPKYRSEDKFKKQFETFTDQSNIVGVNFSKIDTLECKIKFDDKTAEKDVFIDFMSFNSLKLAGGLAGTVLWC